MAGVSSGEEARGDEEFQSTDKATSSLDSRNDNGCRGFSSGEKHFEGDDSLQQDPEETSDSQMRVFNDTALSDKEKLQAAHECIKQLQAKLTRERSQADKKRNEDREKIDSLEKNLGTLNEALNNALRENERLQADQTCIKQLKAELTGEREKNDSLTKDLGTLKEAHNNAVRENERLQENENKLKNDADILRGDVKKNETLLNSMKNVVQEKDETIRRLQTENQNLTQQLDSKTNVVQEKNEQITAKNETIRGLQTENQNLIQQRNSMSNVVPEKNEQIAAKDETIRGLQRENQNLIQQLDSKTNVVQEKNEQIAAKDETIRGLQTENQNLTQQATSSANERNQLRRTVWNLRSHVALLGFNNRGLRHRIRQHENLYRHLRHIINRARTIAHRHIVVPIAL